MFTRICPFVQVTTKQGMNMKLFLLEFSDLYTTVCLALGAYPHIFFLYFSAIFIITSR